MHLQDIMKFSILFVVAPFSTLAQGQNEYASKSLLARLAADEFTKGISRASVSDSKDTAITFSYLLSSYSFDPVILGQWWCSC